MRMRQLLVVAMALSPWLSPVADALARDLTFEDRVNAQEAIERVYYSHQIGATKPFEEAIPRALLEEKVQNYLRESVALERFWNTSVTEPMLRSELDRMVQQTRMPGRLVELLAALGNDPFLIEECLARPVVVHRLAQNFFALDQGIHSGARGLATGIHDGLVANDIDPWVAHPNRTVTRVVRSGVEQPGGSTHPGAGTQLDQGDESVRLELDPIAYESWTGRVPKSVGEIGPMMETRETFVTRVLLESRSTEILVASYVVPKQAWDEWWDGVKGTLSPDLVLPVASTFDLSGDLAAISGSAGPATCAADTWNNKSLDEVAGPRYYHTAIWTGTLMLVWGGAGPNLSGFFNTGGRYDPATDTWSLMSTLNAPAKRGGHTAVWTGGQMIVWGGFAGNIGPYLNTGGRYDPVADVWQSTSLVNAPVGRMNHSAVWTGSLMIVWGGSVGGGAFNTGGRYDPSTDAWSTTSTTHAPAGRYMHSAIWTGNLMIVWGGRDIPLPEFNTGGRYDPVADSWTPTSTLNAPSGRSGHIAIWTGSVMVIWGSFFYFENTEARYDPVTDTWTPMSLVGAPMTRRQFTAVWTGHDVIIWGGFNNQGLPIYFNSGAKYNPVNNTWANLSSVNAPTGRYLHTAVWTGDMMIVWGGSNQYLTLNTGGRYDVEHDTWTPTSIADAPAAREYHTAIWTGSAMIVWGGVGESMLNSGGAYDPAIDSWSATSVTGAPTPRWGHQAVWTGSDMIIWGGQDPTTGLSGGRYHVASGTWFPVSTKNAYPGWPTGSCVWTGSRMIVWGGGYGSPGIDNHGGRYDPAADAWTPTSTVGAPEARQLQGTVWTGDRMIVWGGGGLTQGWLASGGQYDPVGDRWTGTSTVNAPRIEANSAIWTGREMIVWGGVTTTGSFVNVGARYNPLSDTWTATSTVNAPTGRQYHTAIWTGSTMVVWGGSPDILMTFLATGGRYDPRTDSWSPTATLSAPSARSLHTAVWTGDSMIVWGGNDSSALDTGGRYCPCATTIYYRDSDGDGFGNARSPLEACSEPMGFSTDNTDCDDSNPAVHPGSAELCNGIDDNCNGQVDEGFAVGSDCRESVDACHQIIGNNACRADGTGTVCNGQVAFHDVTPPTLSCPADTTAECPTQPILGTASATDACDPNPVVVKEGPASFPLGTTTVVWRATDASGNTSSCHQVVHEVDSTPPVLVCPTPLASECTSPLGAGVTLSATATDACSSTVTIQNNRTPNGADASGTYALGLSPVVFTAQDPSGNTSICTASVTARDTTPPSLTVVTDTPTLWPPNHDLVPIHPAWQVHDVCDPNPGVALLSVTSSEPDDAPGMGDGNTTGDIQGADLGTADGEVDLRAERAGNGPGRVYTLTYRAVDASGNSVPALAVVTVPHDQGQGPEPLLMRLEPDDGAPGMVHLYWPATPGATGYDVISGDLSQAKVENGMLSLGGVRVLARGTTETSLSEGAAGAIPATGNGIFYLIESRTDRSGSGYGTETAPWQRVPGSCDGGCP